MNAEITALKIVAVRIQYQSIPTVEVHVYTDNYTAVRPQGNVYTTSKIIQECRVSLEEIGWKILLTRTSKLATKSKHFNPIQLNSYMRLAFTSNSEQMVSQKLHSFVR